MTSRSIALAASTGVTSPAASTRKAPPAIACQIAIRREPMRRTAMRKRTTASVASEMVTGSSAAKSPRTFGSIQE